MRAILISVAILLMSGPMLAQQRKQAIPVQRTFVPDEPQPCIEFDRMAARLDAVYKTEEISKPDNDEAMKKNRDGTQEQGVDYFIGGERQTKQTYYQQRQPTEINVL